MLFICVTDRNLSVDFFIISDFFQQDDGIMPQCMGYHRSSVKKNDFIWPGRGGYYPPVENGSSWRRPLPILIFFIKNDGASVCTWLYKMILVALMATRIILMRRNSSFIFLGLYAPFAVVFVVMLLCDPIPFPQSSPKKMLLWFTHNFVKHSGSSQDVSVKETRNVSMRRQRELQFFLDFTRRLTSFSRV